MTDDYFQQFAVRALERQREREAWLEQHRTTCELPECDDCQRWSCRCGARVTFRKERCPSCKMRRELEELADRTIPSGQATVGRERGFYHEVLLETDRRLVLEHVKLPPTYIEGMFAWIAAAEKTRPGLLLVGPSHAGKTTLGIALLGEWFRRHHRSQRRVVTAAQFCNAAVLCRRCEEHSRYRGPAPAREAALAASQLVLDDIGQEEPRHRDVVKLLVRERLSAGRPTWITTWLSQTEIEEAYDGAFMAHLRSSSRVVLFNELPA